MLYIQVTNKKLQPMKKSKLALLALGSICFITTTHALEPLESSTDSKAENLTTRLLEKFDSNKDKKIQKTEDEKTWKRNAKFDQNKDQALDSEELKQRKHPRAISTSISSPRTKIPAPRNPSFSSPTEEAGPQEINLKLVAAASPKFIKLG